MFKKTVGVLLDTVTLATIAIFATVALTGMSNPNVGDGIMPFLFGTFAVTLASGSAKIFLNRRPASR